MIKLRILKNEAKKLLLTDCSNFAKSSIIDLCDLMDHEDINSDGCRIIFIFTYIH